MNASLNATTTDKTRASKKNKPPEAAQTATNFQRCKKATTHQKWIHQLQIALIFQHTHDLSCAASIPCFSRRCSHKWALGKLTNSNTQQQNNPLSHPLNLYPLNLEYLDIS